MSGTNRKLGEQPPTDGFDAQKFAGSFGVLAEARNATEQLREFVLDLAMRGQLVAQREGEQLPTVVDDYRASTGEQEPPPFDLPSSWVWVPLGHLARLDIGRTPPTKSAVYWADGKEGHPWVSIADMSQFGEVRGTKKRVSARAWAEIFRGRIAPRGTMLMSFKLTIGKVALLGCDAFHNEAIVSIFPREPKMRDYLFRVLPLLSRLGASKDAIKGTTLNRESLDALGIPVPPLAEQKRIVAKVDELMRLLDDLEAKQAKKRETQTRLRTAALDALTSAEELEEFETAWKRVAENFGILFEHAESVSELRGALIDVAIRGVLTRREPTDGDAHQAVVHMAQQAGYEPEVREPPFRLPSPWAWSRLGGVSSDLRYGYTASARSERAGVRLLRITDIQNDRVNWETVPGCAIDNEKLTSFALRDGDLVIARTGGTIGKTYLVAGLTVQAVFASYLIRVRPMPSVSPDYLKVFTGSGLYWKQLHAGSAGTGQPNVNATTLKTIALPVPPLAEQKRIVAKVEHVMKLCDDLEAKLHRAETTAAKLAEAVVAEMVGT